MLYNARMKNHASGIDYEPIPTATRYSEEI